MPVRSARWAAFAAFVIAGPALAQTAPPIVVSIKPLHSLVVAVTEGVAAPALLVKGYADPHTYSMKPSEAQALSGAKYVVWAGSGVETFLEKPMAALAGKARVLRLDREKSLKLFRVREGAAWEAHAHDEPKKDAKGHKHGHDHGHAHAHTDGHVWLDPTNAIAIVKAVARDLSAIDKPNAAAYTRNAEATVKKLQALDAELAKRLAPLKGKRFIVFHDAYQYLEKRYQLAAAGSILIAADRSPSAQRLHDIRTKIRRGNVACVFGEPQHSDDLVKTAVEGTNARTGKLDPDGGVEVPEGKDAYFTMMRNIGKSLADCLGASS